MQDELRCVSAQRDWPWGQQIADRVPGADENFRLVASEYCSFTGWYLNIHIHLHRLTVVIWGVDRYIFYVH